MTATIQPNTIMVERNDVQQRLSDYKTCIKFYLSEVSLPIYFIENSAFDLASDPDFIEFDKSERFNIIRIEALAEREKGKGYQEFYALDRAIEEFVKESFLIKVTGRYLVRNISGIIPKMTRQLNIDMHKKMAVAITGFFGVNRDLYQKHFAGLYADVNDSKGVFIEHVLYREIFGSDLIRYTGLLPENPDYEGVSGSHGNSMKRNKYKMKVRSLERMINKSLGIPQFLIEY
jgi:hypothetical protein